MRRTEEEPMIKRNLTREPSRRSPLNVVKTFSVTEAGGEEEEGGEEGAEAEAEECALLMTSCRAPTKSAAMRYRLRETESEKRGKG
jgi:hypothetical protein